MHEVCGRRGIRSFVDWRVQFLLIAAGLLPSLPWWVLGRGDRPGHRDEYHVSFEAEDHTRTVKIRFTEEPVVLDKY